MTVCGVFAMCQGLSVLAFRTLNETFNENPHIIDMPKKKICNLFCFGTYRWNSCKGTFTCNSDISENISSC